MIQIGICDENKKDLSQLNTIVKEILDEFSISYNIRQYDCGEKLLESSLVFHFIFLDTVINGKNGIEIAKQMYQKNHSTKIIFQTSFEEYCKEAINKCHAFAFLEKPIQKNLLEEQIREAIQSNENIQENKIRFVNIKYVINGREVKKPVFNISIQKIIYFEYLKQRKEIKMITEKGDFIFSEAMNQLEERMKPLGFEISCRGILINLEKVIRIKGYTIVLDNGSLLPLSQRRVAKFKKRVNEYMQHMRD